MNQTIKQRWIDALRSGEYRKGKRKLCQVNKTNDNATYCCLGVLCELAVQDGVIPAPEYRRGEAVIFGVGSDESQDVLPDAVVAWAEIPYSDENPDAGPTSLAEHNDGSEVKGTKGKPFKQIAKLIEEYL